MSAYCGVSPSEYCDSLQIGRPHFLKEGVRLDFVWLWGAAVVEHGRNSQEDRMSQNTATTPHKQSPSMKVSHTPYLRGVISRRVHQTATAGSQKRLSRCFGELGFVSQQHQSQNRRNGSVHAPESSTTAASPLKNVSPDVCWFLYVFQLWSRVTRKSAEEQATIEWEMVSYLALALR